MIKNKTVFLSVWSLFFLIAQSHATLAMTRSYESLSVTLGTQVETEAGAGHAVRLDAVIVEVIGAQAQDAAAALQNNQDGM
uniref:Uncharacterized protein n=1 Tax=Arundo donax TaxID=35708 RepID=A0A0A9CWY8_ARUDO